MNNIKEQIKPSYIHRMKEERENKNTYVYTKEETLSEKTFVCDKSFRFDNEKRHVVDVDDLKESINKLKKGFHIGVDYNEYEIGKHIDKIFGNGII